MLGSARRASGGFPSPRELNVHFCSRPKKGSKMGAKMEPLGLQNLNYTRFGPPFVRNWSPYDQERKCGPPDGGTPAIRSGRIYGPQEKKKPRGGKKKVI